MTAAGAAPAMMTRAEPDPRAARPWPALWALVVGFFMILLDSTIVSVATPQIMAGLGAGIGEVVWVSSAYLLAYAVPILVTGRLGDRVGPKRVYLVGLAIFTLSSAWCGLAPTIGGLIAARIVQGFGASMMTPQTMATITRIFPPQRRGAAMGVWGSVAGVATLVGPVLGGLLTDSVGWRWIFFVNVPVGVLAAVLVWRLVPRLTTHPHKFDLIGVALSAVGLFLIVFGVQEGQGHDWGAIWGVVGVWHLIVLGVVVMGLFVLWQVRSPNEPLIPMHLFADRNFSLANTAIAAVGFTITAMAFPLMLFTQGVLGLSPTVAALILVPQAVLAAALAPFVGRNLGTRLNPRHVAVTGLVLMSVSLAWFSRVMAPDVSISTLLLPSSLLGVANAFVWGPISVTATRNLPPQLAGAGSGVYNATRQLGAVLGSAAIAAAMESRLAAALPASGSMSAASMHGVVPAAISDGFSTAMSQAMLVPAGAILLGAVAAAFFAPAQASAPARRPAHPAGDPALSD
jgi:EmrB/QacA subfamily drug resistance transporter